MSTDKNNSKEVSALYEGRWLELGTFGLNTASWKRNSRSAITTTLARGVMLDLGWSLHRPSSSHPHSIYIVLRPPHAQQTVLTGARAVVRAIPPPRRGVLRVGGSPLVRMTSRIRNKQQQELNTKRKLVPTVALLTGGALYCLVFLPLPMLCSEHPSLLFLLVQSPPPRYPLDLALVSPTQTPRLPSPKTLRTGANSMTGQWRREDTSAAHSERPTADISAGVGRRQCRSLGDLTDGRVHAKELRPIIINHKMPLV